MFPRNKTNGRDIVSVVGLSGSGGVHHYALSDVCEARVITSKSCFESVNILSANLRFRIRSMSLRMTKAWSNAAEKANTSPAIIYRTTLFDFLLEKART